jgi:heme/copper-type cytochrome/quinol oxidase subunit 2
MPTRVDTWRARLARGLLGCAIVLGSLAFWTVLPVGWIRMTSAFEPGAQFVLVIVGCPLTMVVAFLLLAKTEAYRRRLSPAYVGEEEEEGRGLLEVTLVGSAVLALAALVTWWFFIADTANPSGPLQPI